MLITVGLTLLNTISVSVTRGNDPLVLSNDTTTHPRVAQ
jgi:hypothetical protein